VKGTRIGDAGGPHHGREVSRWHPWLSSFVVYFLAAVLWRRWVVLVVPVVVATAVLIGIAKVADRTQRGTAVVNVVASIAATAAIAIIVGVVE
jgi:Na+/H+-dicarboxylate symporter